MPCPTVFARLYLPRASMAGKETLSANVIVFRPHVHNCGSLLCDVRVVIMFVSSAMTLTPFGPTDGAGL